MAGKAQPVRRKKTKEAVKKSKLANRSRLVKNENTRQINEFKRLRRDRIETQMNLSVMLSNIDRMEKFIESSKVSEKLDETTLSECNTAINEFKETMNSGFPHLKKVLKNMEALETSVLEGKDKYDNVLLDYNLGVADLISGVVTLSQEGTNTLMKCNAAIEQGANAAAAATAQTEEDKHESR